MYVWYMVLAIPCLSGPPHFLLTKRAGATRLHVYIHTHTFLSGLCVAYSAMSTRRGVDESARVYMWWRGWWAGSSPTKVRCP